MQKALALLLVTGIGAQLVGPGGVVPYGGGGGGPRRLGTVRDWAQGFFVAGSALDELNGVYARIEPNTARRACRARSCKVAYRNGESDWILAFGGPPAGLETKSGKATEWVFVDQSGRDRFEHEGDTVIPGAGDSWHFSHRPSPYERAAAEDLAAGAPDDAEELPWQVIYIGDPGMVSNLMHQRRHHDAVIRNALAGHSVDPFGALQSLAAPDGAARDEREPMEPPADLLAKADASEAAQHAGKGDYARCADAWCRLGVLLLASTRLRGDAIDATATSAQGRGQVRYLAVLETRRGAGDRALGVGRGGVPAGRVLPAVTALRRGADRARGGVGPLSHVRFGARGRRGVGPRLGPRGRRPAQRRAPGVDRPAPGGRARRRRLRRRRRGAEVSLPGGVAQPLPGPGRHARFYD